ncbi:hypothetical protein dsx2_0920 [Desulfovibrio sp. X2]|uniref:hypothetical protein n=1 Tax=Desulfovibrio sp. X2 TaxID=941449 RepID=UPI000358A4AC|nr:hypothetical protein [Desulfovibrio sp. X2]EPR37574.1 hypothetical protein dsx2_0920 [Desulfovibrio sp. X2]
MSSPLKQFRDVAARLAAPLPRPAFYTGYAMELEGARTAFFEEPLLRRLRDDSLTFLYDDFGFGIEHSKTVAVEAAAIVAAETASHGREESRRMVLMALLAGLLHDATRLEQDAAARAADLSLSVLASYALADEEREMIAGAIAAHETPTGWTPPADPRAALLAGALYDADKFRYGPDVYVTSLWEHCDYEELPLSDAPHCLALAEKRIPALRGTFRTNPGRLHGESFLAVGQRLLPVLAGELESFLAEAEATKDSSPATRRART